MSDTEWVGGRVAAPLFVEARGGFQADIIVWMDATRDLVVAMEAVHPSDPDSRVVDVLKHALQKPMAGPRRRPDRVRVAQTRLAELIAPAIARVPVRVAPTPEIDRMVETMGQSMPGANPLLADFRRLLHEQEGLVRRLLPAAARLLHGAPWSFLWDSEAIRLDVPDLDVAGACISVLGRSEQSWGLAVFPSAREFRVVQDAPASPAGEALGTEALSLTFAEPGEFPAVLRRELVELGWEPGNLAMCPLWCRSTPEGAAMMASQHDLRILLAAAAGLAEHVARHRKELAGRPIPPRTEEYRVETDACSVIARITTPHPEVPWESIPAPEKRTKRPRRDPPRPPGKQ